MSNLNQFTGAVRPPKAIINKFSAGGVSATSFATAGAEKEILSGALVANTLKTLLSVSGSGAIKTLFVYTKNVSAKNVRLKLTIDGVSVFDAISGSITVTGAGMSVIGVNYYSADHFRAMELVPFTSSVVVEVASSLSETDAVAIAVIYETR